MKRVMTTIALVGACWALVGCSPGRRPLLAGVSRHMPGATLADKSGAGGASAVDAARGWSNKYAGLADRCMKLQQENNALAEKNRQLLAKEAGLHGDLGQSRKELGDANAMLTELNDELAKWKRDVLGFLTEMRGAQQVQLELMKKMVVLLGGEVPQIGKTAAEKLAATTKE